MVGVMKDVFTHYPEIREYLEKVAAESEEMVDAVKSLLSLVADLSYKDGMVDGIKYVMDELLKNHRLAYATLFLTAWMAQKAATWPHGVLMRLIA